MQPNVDAAVKRAQGKDFDVFRTKETTVLIGGVERKIIQEISEASPISRLHNNPEAFSRALSTDTELAYKVAVLDEFNKALDAKKPDQSEFLLKGAIWQTLLEADVLAARHLPNNLPPINLAQADVPEFVKKAMGHIWAIKLREVWTGALMPLAYIKKFFDETVSKISLKNKSNNLTLQPAQVVEKQEKKPDHNMQINTLSNFAQGVNPDTSLERDRTNDEVIFATASQGFWLFGVYNRYDEKTDTYTSVPTWTVPLAKYCDPETDIKEKYDLFADKRCLVYFGTSQEIVAKTSEQPIAVPTPEGWLTENTTPKRICLVNQPRDLIAGPSRIDLFSCVDINSLGALTLNPDRLRALISGQGNSEKSYALEVVYGQNQSPPAWLGKLKQELDYTSLISTKPEVIQAHYDYPFSNLPKILLEVAKRAPDAQTAIDQLLSFFNHCFSYDINNAPVYPGLPSGASHIDRIFLSGQASCIGASSALMSIIQRLGNPEIPRVGLVTGFQGGGEVRYKDLHAKTIYLQDSKEGLSPVIVDPTPHKTLEQKKQEHELAIDFYAKSKQLTLVLADVIASLPDELSANSIRKQKQDLAPKLVPLIGEKATNDLLWEPDEYAPSNYVIHALGVARFHESVEHLVKLVPDAENAKYLASYNSMLWPDAIKEAKRLGVLHRHKRHDAYVLIETVLVPRVAKKLELAHSIIWEDNTYGITLAYRVLGSDLYPGGKRTTNREFVDRERENFLAQADIDGLIHQYALLVKRDGFGEFMHLEYNSMISNVFYEKAQPVEQKKEFGLWLNGYEDKMRYVTSVITRLIAKYEPTESLREQLVSSTILWKDAQPSKPKSIKKEQTKTEVIDPKELYKYLKVRLDEIFVKN